MCSCSWIVSHTHMGKWTHIHITCTHTHTHTHTHTQTYTHIHTHTHTHTYIHTHTHIHVHNTHTYIHTHTHTHTHIYTHTYTHTRAHTYTCYTWRILSYVLHICSRHLHYLPTVSSPLPRGHFVKHSRVEWFSPIEYKISVLVRIITP